MEKQNEILTKENQILKELGMEMENPITKENPVTKENQEEKEIGMMEEKVKPK